jgi:hypothetical protein
VADLIAVRECKRMSPTLVNPGAKVGRVEVLKGTVVLDWPPSITPLVLSKSLV